MAKKATNLRPSPKKPHVPVIAIGGSAGGMEAMSELLRHLSPSNGFAYVYVQHLDPTHESMLPAIFAKDTRMPVVQAKELMPLEANTVYIIPPNKDMEVVDGVLTLLPRRAKPFLHLPIDQFFISVAERQKSGAVGIVLSGMARDGTQGLKAIKAAGGIAFAQDETAKFQGMPMSAIAEGVVDMVLSPAQIAKELGHLSAYIEHQLLQPEEAEAASVEISPEEGENLRAVLQLLKKSVGVDFSHYKINTVQRRIIRRMLLHKMETLGQYAKYLKQHDNELNTLYNDLLINVTTFFRDEACLEYLKKTLLPRIIKEKRPNDPIRIWVPACSTGEEAYSLAIVLIEILGDRAANTSIQIFATDLSDRAITKARQGTYTRSELMDVSPKRLQRFFTKVEEDYRIVKSIRDLCVFAPHNVVKDPPFSRLDLVSCCNLLIYLDPVLQKKVLATFHYSLNPTGYLVLGKSESIGTSAHLFSQVEKSFKVYMRRNEAVSRALFDMNYRLPGAERVEAAAYRKNRLKDSAQSSNLEKLVDSMMLTQYAPASVVVSQDLEIIQFRGSTSLFLEPSPGKASLNLLKMARQGLAFELRSAIHKVQKSGQPIKKSGLEIKNKNNTHVVAFEVVPIKTDLEEALYLVVFEETGLPVASDMRAAVVRDRRIKQLEEELNTVREDMRAIIEEQEAVNEELQSANEEIVSSNEELQSINEELETSKEEVESSNEELMTINQELQLRNEQLAEAIEYAETVFTTVWEAVLVLDKDLRVKTTNKAFYKAFQYREEEVEGRLIYELGNGQWDIPALRRLLESVMNTRTEYKGFEMTFQLPGGGQKIILLNARTVIQATHRQQLILLAIEDVTNQRQAEQLMAEREAWFHNMADNAPVMIWVADPDKRCTYLNRTWLDFTGHTLEEEIKRGWFEGAHPDDRELCLGIYATHFEQQQPFQFEYRLRRRDGEYRWVVDNGKPTFAIDGTFTGFVGTCTDIHAQKTVNQELDLRVQHRTQALMEANAELKRSNEELQQYAYVASHDLQEPLRKIIMFSDRLEKQHFDTLPEQSKGWLTTIMNSTQRMARLIDDLLNFSRAVRTSKESLPIDLNEILKQVLEDFEVIVQEKKAVIRVDKLPVIEASPVQMTQLFHNLLSNALKFTSGSHQPRITIVKQRPKSEKALRFCADRGIRQAWEIIVSDNGIGFEPHFAELVFVIFQRLNDPRTYAGTGLGLALCRRIVENHGGLIFARSNKGEGASFHVVLPEKRSQVEREV